MSIETFENPYPNRKYEISWCYEEFTAICPLTRQPDYAKIMIRYIPTAKCLELKSFKIYLQSYRDKHIFNEEIINKIADDVIGVCEPFFLEIVGKFNIREGIRPIVKVRHGEQDNRYNE